MKWHLLGYAYLLAGVGTLGYSLQRAGSGKSPWLGFGGPGAVLGAFETVALWPLALGSMVTAPS